MGAGGFFTCLYPTRARRIKCTQTKQRVNRSKTRSKPVSCGEIAKIFIGKVYGFIFVIIWIKME